jgi:hypothetical protein
METVEERYKARIREARERVDRHILNGKCVDHAEYLARISERMAYRRAEDDFKRSLNEYIEETEALDPPPGSEDNGETTDE